jgi:hypothetical protein
MGDHEEGDEDLEVKVKITAPDGTTYKTDMDGLKNGLNQSVKNHRESVSESED